VLLAVWGATHGDGPFAASSPEENARSVQFFLIAMSVPVLLLAAALEERRKDLVAQQRAELEAKEQRLQLTHLTRVALLGQLSGALAHELNQPLTAILSNAQAAQRFLAADRIDPEELREILGDIVAADQRAGEVIRRLRALFKKGETQFQLLDTNDVVREALDLAHGDLVTRNIEVTTDLAPRLPSVTADRVQMQQVLLNLLINASEAMSANAPDERTLTVRTQALGGGVQVSVADCGPGIPEDRELRLFEPFFTTKPQGLGLGLSISRSIVTAHGGRLWSTNNPFGGATFHVALPNEPGAPL
jgi:C4-dicarboxylate-specific signal transduction histidine kinase